MHSMKRPTRIRVMRTLTALTLVAGAASCGGGKPPVKSDILFRSADTLNPEKFAFHTLGATDGTVRCTASIDTNPKAAFQFKLTSDFDVVAVKLTVHLSSHGEHEVDLRESTMQPVLFLENGTALPSVDPGTIRGSIKQKYHSAFDDNVFEYDGLLTSRGDNKAEGYVFFQLPCDPLDGDVEFTVAGTDGSAYAVNLRHSLVRFTYTIDDGKRQAKQTINVGTK